MIVGWVLSLCGWVGLRCGSSVLCMFLVLCWVICLVSGLCVLVMMVWVMVWKRIWFLFEICLVMWMKMLFGWLVRLVLMFVVIMFMICFCSIWW